MAERILGIRCNDATIELFNAVCAENPQFTRGEMLSRMINSYIRYQNIGNDIYEIKRMLLEINQSKA